jgi:hypothetical protein
MRHEPHLRDILILAEIVGYYGILIAGAFAVLIAPQH